MLSFYYIHSVFDLMNWMCCFMWNKLMMMMMNKSLLTVLHCNRATPLEVCAGDPFTLIQASGVFFHWVCQCHPHCIVQFWLRPLCLLLWPSRKCPRCSFTICDEQRSVFFSVPLRGHTSALYRWVDRIIALYNLIFTFRLIHLFFHIFLIFPNTCCFPRYKLWCHFNSCHCVTCSKIA